MPDLTPERLADLRALAESATVVSPDVATALLDEIDRLRSALAALAALVEVAAGAASDETAHDPGVMKLMRYLAARHPVEADASPYVEELAKAEQLARQQASREAVAIVCDLVSADGVLRLQDIRRRATAWVDANEPAMAAHHPKESNDA